MATQESGKDVLKQSSVTETVVSQELHEDDLHAVTGGLSNSMGAALSSINTAVCVSTD